MEANRRDPGKTVTVRSTPAGVAAKPSSTLPEAPPQGSKPRVYSLVPGAAPIELLAYYDAFKDYYPEAELQTKRWFVDTVGADWTVLDIGANVGVYSLLAARLAPKGYVHAFEPTSTAAMLRQNLQAAGVRNVTVHEVALGARNGCYEDAIYRILGEAPERQMYRFMTADAFVEETDLKRVDCIKIDVDGFDLEVLKGATKTLARFDPWIVVEFNHALATRGQSFGEALLWVRSQGYARAHVLDMENYLLKRSDEAAGESSAGVIVTFEREPVLLPPCLEPAELVPGLLREPPILQNGAAFFDDGQNRITIGGPRWAFMATWDREPLSISGPVIVEVTMEIEGCAVGLGCLMDDTRTYVGKESMIDPSPLPQIVRITVPDIAPVKMLVLRNVDPQGAAGTVAIRSIKCSTARPAAGCYSPVLRSYVRTFDLNSCLRMTAAAPRPIRIVPVGVLGTTLGFSTPYVPERLIFHYGLGDFKTELDKSGLFRYIYKNFSPRRHLEFGTWEGFGTTLCAESCDAEIWTINLPEGERDATGRHVYSSQTLPAKVAPSPSSEDGPGDVGTNIGWRYRAAGFGHRVHQILCDSHAFDDRSFPNGFFDTILVDGGHAAEVVTNDTNKAIRLLRPGGLMIWHDFCPDPDVLAQSEAGRGVVQAIADNYDQWVGHFKELFWLRPSWLLVGVKAPTSA